jgi:hypothetical protein
MSPALTTSNSPNSTTVPSSSPVGPSSSTTPRTSSPLNPGSTPVSAPIALTEDDGDPDNFPDPPSRARGAAVSTRKKPLHSSSPAVKVTSSPASTVTPLPDQQGGRLSSFFQRSRSRSPSERINERIWRKKVNDVETSPSPQGQEVSPSASWWGERNANAKSWEDSPKRRRNMSVEEEKAWDHTREVS